MDCMISVILRGRFCCDSQSFDLPRRHRTYHWSFGAFPLFSERNLLPKLQNVIWASYYWAEFTCFKGQCVKSLGNLYHSKLWWRRFLPFPMQLLTTYSGRGSTILISMYMQHVQIRQFFIFRHEKLKGFFLRLSGRRARVVVQRLG